MIPYNEISVDRKKVLDNIMRDGNRVLKHYHEIFKNNLFIPKCNRIKFLNLIMNEAGSVPKDVSINGIDIPKQDVEKIFSVKNIEWEVLCGYSRAIQKVVNRHHPADASVSQEDLMGEAIHSAIVAIYHFCKDDVKFLTFLQHCVNRHLTYRIGSFSHLSKKAYDLVVAYQRTKNKTNGPCNFENVVKIMDLSEKEIKILKNALSKTNNCTDLNIEDINIISNKMHQNDSEDTNKINEILNKIDLSVLERAVLDGFLHSDKNSKTCMGLGTFAKDIINPVTGRPYSRQSLSLAWNRVKAKIANIYNEKAA
jgi:hypothetical protein